MKSNYKRLGNFIQEVNARNTELKISNLLGINIDKFFMPSVANIVGTDLTTYKVVKPGQFACNRMHVGRDKRLPVALSKENTDFIVSPAYDVFEVIDEKILNPEYLMMWFSRKEFDRNAWFYTDADVRGGLSWNDFCNLQIPILSLSKQIEIVKEYNIIVDRIKLNNRTIEQLEEIAQAIYKRWFSDFDFPDEDGNPYKLNGGVMEYNNELGIDIPYEWKLEKYETVMNFRTGKLNSNAAVENGKYPFFTCSTKTFRTNTYSFDTEAVILAGNNASAIYPLKFFTGKFDAYQRTYVITSRCESLSNKQIFFSIKSELENFKGTSSGTATKFLTLNLLNDLKIVIPDKFICKKFENIMDIFFHRLQIADREGELLIKLCDILLSKLATMEG